MRMINAGTALTNMFGNSGIRGYAMYKFLKPVASAGFLQLPGSGLRDKRREGDKKRVAPLCLNISFTSSQKRKKMIKEEMTGLFLLTSFAFINLLAPPHENLHWHGL
jgi:hypothetical protein